MIRDIVNGIAALVLLVLTSPIIIISIFLILVFDFQNPFFTQTRLGLNKSNFTIYKLRTMKKNQITFIGKILRKTGIDELPQLVNIFIGQMHFVGPRPLTLDDVERLSWNSFYYVIRWDVKPGLTGLAQLSPVCNKKMSWQLDKIYVLKNSVWLNCKILLISSIIPIIGKNKAIQLFHSSKK